MSGPTPWQVDDPVRLAAVEATGLLDTGPDPAFDDLATLAAKLLGAPFAFITLVDDHRSFWKSRIGLAADGPLQNTVEESFCQYVVRSGQPLIAGDVTANPLTASNPSIESMGVRAWAGFPVMSPDGQPLGSFCVVDTVVRQWQDSDIDVLRALSEAAGREIALRAAARAAAVANGHLALLVEVGQALTETLDAEEAVGRLAKLLVPILGDWSLIALADEEGALRDVGWWHSRPSGRPALDRLAGERWIGVAASGGATLQALGSRRPSIVYPDATEVGIAALGSTQARDAYRELNPGSYGAWPLASRTTVHGVLGIARDAGRQPFTPAEVELLNNVAERAGTVLDNSRLYAGQRAIAGDLADANARLHETARHARVVARALQNAMLTRLPEPDHVRIAARYLTADGNEQVGGDWYDVLLPPDKVMTIMVGDVAGHNIDAATIMGQLRNLLRAFAWEHDDDPPSALITRLDRAMRDLDIATMTTLVVARIDRDVVAERDGLRTLRWSSAGHPAPIVVGADGVAKLLRTQSDPPLAAVRDAARHDHTATISPGETLLLYTDGLIETRNLDWVERQGQLLQVLAGGHQLNLDELLDAVVASMVADQPDDDVALLAIRFPPEHQRRP